MAFNLDSFLIAQLFAILVVFTRLGAGVMVLPGIGEGYVSVRARLLIAILLALAISPGVMKMLPPVPTTPLSLGLLLAAEALIGLTIGMVARFLVAIMHVAGSLISLQAGLSLATQFDYSQASQGTMIGNFLSLTAVLMLFLLDLHYVILHGLFDSYTLFSPGSIPPVDDLAVYFSGLLGQVFTLGFQLAAPVIVVGLLVYLGVGVLAKLMPAMQVFNIFQPAQILIAFVILVTSFTAIMTSFSDSFEMLFGAFIDDGVS